MSLSWRDRLIAALGPGELQLQRRAPAWRGGRLKLAAVASCAAAGDAEAPPWASPLATLRESLRDRRWAGSAATVVLSDHFVRYLLIPWDEQLVGDEEQAAMVRYAFTSAYGPPAEEWSFRWDVPPPPAPCFACAIDGGLLGGLREAFADAALSLVSIQPQLMSAFNARRQTLPGHGSYWFLAEERGRISLAWLNDGSPHALYSQRVAADRAVSLPELLERGLLLAGPGSAPGAVYLHPATPEGDGPLSAELPAELPGGWALHRLPPAAAIPD